MLFNRNKNKDPTPPPTSFERPEAEAVEAKLYPGPESKRLNATVTGLDTLQQDFLDACVQKGLDPETASEAMLAAMREGVYPTVLSTRPRRDNVRVVFIVYGTPPEGLVEVMPSAKGFSVRVDGSKWPTEPDADDPTGFYVESHEVEPADEIPFYGDERDQATAVSFRDLNAQLLSMLPTTR